MRNVVASMLVFAALSAGFSSRTSLAQDAPEPMDIVGESFVLIGQEPGFFMFPNVDPGSVVVRSAYRPDAEGAIVYQAGRDYTIDAQLGAIVRTAESRIPDFSTNVLYGQQAFNHTEFPGYGNLPFFVFVDYQTSAGKPFGAPSDQRDRLAKTRAKLEAGGAFKIVVYGDSISAGGEATDMELRFSRRYAQLLRERFPKAEIMVENGATGGDATSQGIQRLEEKVLTRQPDLVLIGFGMNDNNVGGVDVPSFRENLTKIVQSIKNETKADIILHSAFPPNPNWKFGSADMPEIAKVTEEVAAETGSGFADVYSIWMTALERKRPESLLANNINHPNDFGHWIYYQALANIQF